MMGRVVKKALLRRGTAVFALGKVLLKGLLFADTAADIRRISHTLHLMVWDHPFPEKTGKDGNVASAPSILSDYHIPNQIAALTYRTQNNASFSPSASLQVV